MRLRLFVIVAGLAACGAPGEHSAPATIETTGDPLANASTPPALVSPPATPSVVPAVLGGSVDFTPEQLEFFYGFPVWVVALWAIAVWGGVLGAVLLLMRKKPAVPVFLASFVAMVITTIHNYGFDDAMAVNGAGGAAFSAVIFVIALGLWLYSKKMAGRGVLA